MSTLVILLWMVAAVLCGLRGFGVVGPGHAHLGWLGVTAALLAVLLGQL